MADECVSNIENGTKTEVLTTMTEMTHLTMPVYSKNGVKISALGIREVDNTISVLIIVFKSDKLVLTLNFKRTELSTATQELLNYKIGLKAEDIVKINREISSKYNDFKVIPAVNGCGWQFKDNEAVTGFANVVHLDLFGKKLPTYNNAVTSKGNLNTFCETLKSYFENNPKRQVIFCIALSSVICGLIKHSIVTVLVGNSSCGKTTFAKMCLSAFTNTENPRFSNTFNATENYIVQTLTDNNGIPVLIDDTSLTKQKDLDAFLYQVASGRERGRLNNDGVTGKQRMWATSALLTAEKSVLFSGDLNLKGKVGRVLEINISDTELFDDAEQAEKIQSLYRENFGLIEPVYLKSLLECQITERIYTLLNDEIKEIRALSQTNDELVKRLEKTIAIVSLTSKFINIAFDFEFSCDEIRNYMIELCKENVKMYREIYDSVIDFSKVYNEMIKHIIDRANTKNNSFAVISSDDFKLLYQQFAASVGSKTIKDFKTTLKQNACLFVNSGDYGYRTANFRGYAFRIKDGFVNE